MPQSITAADVDRVADSLGVQLTPWQRDTLVNAYAARHRTGRFPVVLCPRRPGRATIARVAQQLAATA
ncbi:hypothetical protein L3Q65_46055 [Amycolatopsis sp. FU40]|uniref:hypothetical protein n=1 Tax=Amycolatopsis sp. FU40 TaxID=2914159 RepID=UPI001F22BA2B|nr:hypothetical protein [Amycolatopsis sp. FU40]UKD55139.1 hypothetical protein L3Q65_46055 [Amycolatopsis sp. FU40]